MPAAPAENWFGGAASAAGTPATTSRIPATKDTNLRDMDCPPALPTQGHPTRRDGAAFDRADARAGQASTGYERLGPLLREQALFLRGDGSDYQALSVVGQVSDRRAEVLPGQMGRRHRYGVRCNAAHRCGERRHGDAPRGVGGRPLGLAPPRALTAAQRLRPAARVVAGRARSTLPTQMNESTIHDLAARAGVDDGDVRRLMDLGFLKADAPVTAGVVRVVRLIDSLERAGVSVDAMARAQGDGILSFAYLELPVFDRFSSLSGLTFRDLAAETGIPADLLMVIREAIGFAQPSPDDLVRDDELTVVPAVRTHFERGLSGVGMKRWLRVYGESAR